jgi:hypothetical protein
MVTDAYGESMQATLKFAQFAPKHDPAPLAALIGSVTRSLGVVAAMSTLVYPPFRFCHKVPSTAQIATIPDHEFNGI